MTLRCKNEEKGRQGPLFVGVRLNCGIMKCQEQLRIRVLCKDRRERFHIERRQKEKSNTTKSRSVDIVIDKYLAA